MMKKKYFDCAVYMCGVLYSTIVLQMKQSLARPMFRFCLIVNPIINTFFLYELYYQHNMEMFIKYVVLGAGLMGVWGCICFSSVGDINRERFMGTLPFIYVAPSGFGTIILGKVLGNTLLSLMTFVLSYISGRIFCGQKISISHRWYFCISMLLTVICFIVVSLCFAYALMLSRKTSLYMNILEIPLVFLCGFTMPIEVLPEWMQCVSRCLAPTWTVKMLRMSVESINIELYAEYLRIVLLQIAILVVIIILLYHWIDLQIRKKATLEVS